jgi:NTP pyrophosphatase (non-canonical NTP hydrolase)
MGPLGELALDIHVNAQEKGFWDHERNMGEMLMLMTSELAEALEEHRDGKPNVYYRCTNKDCQYSRGVHDKPYPGHVEYFGDRGPDGSKCSGTMKPEGVAVELADCLIRILDTMSSLGVDVDEVVQTKMTYNGTRAHKHGKAY